MISRTLVLTPWYLPARIVRWEEAVTLLYLGKVEVVVAYDEVVRSPSVALRTPAVVRMKRKRAGGPRKVRFSRRNVYVRDGHCCVYCGTRASEAELTLDHVVPRSRGGRTTWDNVVAACRPCNAQKGGRTPTEARLRLRHLPYEPRSLPEQLLAIDLRTAPVEWHAFVRELSPRSA